MQTSLMAFIDSQRVHGRFETAVNIHLDLINEVNSLNKPQHRYPYLTNLYPMAGVPYSVSTSQVRKDEILHHSHGRAPWYDMQGVPSNAYVIGIAGGSASGKVCISS